MGLFFTLLGLFLLVSFFMPWINHARIGRLRDEANSLRQRISQLEAQLRGAEIKKPIEEPVAPQQKAALDQPPEVKKEIKKEEYFNIVPRASATDWAAKAQSIFGGDTDKSAPDEVSKSAAKAMPSVVDIKSSFEQNIATKLPVWIGAISLIFAAFFLVKYSIELGWMQPTVRVMLGALFGVVLLGAGQWMANREHLANSARISQALVGAGIVALYVSIYAGINLYSLMSPIIGFGAMAAVTVLAVILSVRHGQAIAIFGLLGGLMTPALINTDAPSAISLFGYLFLLFAFMFAVLVRQGWWLLAIISVIGVFSWSIFWFMLIFASSDAFVLLVFAMAIAFVVLAVTGKRIAEENIPEKQKLPIHGLNFTAMAGAMMTIIWLSLEMTLTLFDWSMLGLLTMALIALASFQPRIYQKPLWAMLGASLILFFVWAHNAPINDAVMVLLGMSVIYVGGGAIIMRKLSDPRYWAALQVISALGLYSVAYFSLDLSGTIAESFSMFWGLVALVLAGLSVLQLSDIFKKYKADDVIREHLLAIYLLCASAFITLGLSIELPGQYVPLAIAAQIAVTAVIFEKSRIEFLQNIMAILALVFVAMNYEQIILFGSNILGSVFDQRVSSSLVRRFAFDVPTLKAGVPCLFIFLSLWILIKTQTKNKKVIFTLFSVATLCALTTAYYMIRDLFHSGGAIAALSSPIGFVERGAITMACALAGIGFFYMVDRFHLSFLKFWAHILFYCAVVRFAYFDLIIHNPYFSSSQMVGPVALFNGVTFTYGLGALMCVWAMSRNNLWPHKSFYKALGLLALFTFVTFTVRQYFHGSKIVEGHVSSAELYSYSVAWLVTGLALLAYGIQRHNKMARMASLGFIVLAVLKVFLFDAAELEGLYRVFSFLGLGVSLIGLSFFYTKFVFANEGVNKKL